MSGLKQFLICWKRDGFKKTWKRMKYNYVMLDSPEQMLKKEIWGGCGMLGAIVLVLSVFAYRKQYFLLPLFVFIFYVNFTQVKGKLTVSYTHLTLPTILLV